MVNMSEMMSENTRFCHIVKRDDFDGYGFDLHAEKGKPGQYIGKVDPGSPAQTAGLRQGDRILEVNGESIAEKTHKEVVALIKAGAGETKLLVVDPLEESAKKPVGEAPMTIINDTNGTAKQSNGHSLSNGHDEHHEEKNASNNNKSEQQTLNLNMTAAELRARLAAKKKFDPKKETMDFKKKFEIIQKM